MLNQGFWQQVAEYDREILGVFRDSPAARPVIDFLARHAQGKVVADLGCGPGQSFPYRAGAKCVFAVDSSAEMLVQARKNSPREAADRFRFIRADLADYLIGQRNRSNGCRHTWTFDRALEGDDAFRALG